MNRLLPMEGHHYHHSQLANNRETVQKMVENEKVQLVPHCVSWPLDKDGRGGRGTAHTLMFMHRLQRDEPHVELALYN